LKLLELVKIYEACMLHLDKTPLISYNSGTGRIDYHNILNEWLALTKEIKVA